MPSSLRNFTKFRAELDHTLLTTADVAGKYPDDPALAAILGEMRQLKLWTENGQAPTPAPKNTLSFGSGAL